MENNGKGLFYGVIGVATLIVAIIGATFAYFTATASSSDNVVGTAATVNLSVAVSRVDTNTSGLIPVDSGDISKALVASTMCQDTKGYTACHVYKAVVTNTSANPVTVAGSVTLSSTGLTDLYSNAVVTGTNPTYGTKGSAVKVGTAMTLVVDGATNAETLAATNGTCTYYFVVYIQNSSTLSQDDQQAKGYTGTVTINSSTGSELKATFS